MARTWCVAIFASLAVTLEASTGTPSGANDAIPAPTASASATPDPSELPPPGIVPTGETLGQVLALYHQGLGRPAHAFTTSRETDTYSGRGETGTITRVDSGNDFLESDRIGPTTEYRGELKGRRWRQDANGYTRTISGIHTEEDVSLKAWAQAADGRDVASVKLLGTVSSPVNAYVVEVHPSSGRLEWLFVDSSTGRLVRREDAYLGRRRVWTFDDFRTTNGLTDSWHWHLDDGFPGNDVDWRTTALAYGTPVAPTELAIPQRRLPVQFPQGAQRVRLPARIEDGRIIVRLTINGRGLDFQLDSGSSSIVIDRDVVDELGLATYGHTTAAIAGKFSVATAIVPEMDIGALAMHDVAVDVLPFHFNPDFSTKVVGLLGYDFLAGIVAKIDYYSGTVDAFDPSAFAAPQDDAFQLPMKLDDSVPMVNAVVGGASGDDFILDTGADMVVVFAPFADAHPDDLPVFRYTLRNQDFVPLVFAQGVGGKLQMQPIIPKEFQFAGVDFDNFIVFKLVGRQEDFQGEDSDGLIGFQLLRYFDVYLDYDRAVVTLQKNPYRRTTPSVYYQSIGQ